MGIRISEMEEATTFGADDYVPIVTNGTNKKALGAKIKNFIAGFFVSKSGDTMSGDLSINATNAKTKCINPDMILDTSANNNLSADSDYGVSVTDKNGAIAGSFNVNTRANGQIVTSITANNKKTDGTDISNYIAVIMSKDGTRSYYVPDKAAFRSAIGLGSFYFMETVLLNPAQSKSTSLNTYSDACYALIGLIATSASNRGFLFVLFNVKDGAVHQNVVVNTNDFNNLTRNSNGTININFSTTRYASLDIYRLTNGY